eukprot:gene8473-8656_t
MMLSEGQQINGANASSYANGTLNPASPQTNIVPSSERPGGHWATPRGRTPLQQHLDYFDISGCISKDGYFLPSAFEAIWSTHDPMGRGRLSLRNVLELVWNKSKFTDIFGSFATAVQWLLTWWLFHDDDGLLRKNDIRGIYDGTAFYRLADRTGNPWYGMSARRDAVQQLNMG